MIRFPPERQAHWYVRLAYAVRNLQDLYVTDDELAELQATVPEPASPWAPIDAAPGTGVAWFAGTPVRVHAGRAATQTTGAEAWAAEIKRAREAEEQRLRSLFPPLDLAPVAAQVVLSDAEERRIARAIDSLPQGRLTIDGFTVLGGGS